MKKFIGFIICFIFCFIFLVSCGDETENNSERLIDSARTIKVVQVEGSATVTDDKETINCYKGMNLYDGDVLNVNHESIIVIKFDEDKYVYIGEDSKLNIKSEGTDKFKTNIFVEKGKVLAEIKNQLGVDEEFFLSSNNSVMAVRGTVFGITVKKVGQEIIQKYSVYRGVTELYLFDVANDGKLISGKISDIQNSEYEIKIPESEILNENTDYNNSVNGWLADVDNDFDDSEGANDELEEVQITVGTPTMEDYQEIIETVGTGGGSNVTYSNINYKATGYYGEYDGLPHSMTIDVEVKDAKIYYKTSEDGQYSETIPTFTEPGYYRTYYKITCEGYADKEDYGVVQIYKSDLEIQYTNNLIVPGLIQGMPLEEALYGIDLSEYIVVKGALSDADALANTTFSVSGTLESGTNTYPVTVNLDDSIKDYYNDITAEISLTTYEIKLEQTMQITNGSLDISSVTDFNKYNGVLGSALFNYPEFSAGGVSLYYYDVSFNYDYITNGYYELKEGKNTVEVVIDFYDYDVTAEVYFNFNDSRQTINYDIVVDEVTVTTLSEGRYYFNTNDISVVNNKYHMTTAYFADHLGISDFTGYINLPTDILNENSVNYQVSNSNYIDFPVDSTSEIKLLTFPTSTTKGSVKTISVYFSTTAPDVVPTYTLKPSLSYYPGENFDFVISNNTVTYSLDDVNYQSELSISDLGEHLVYFKVGDQVITKGSSTVLITNVGIESDGLDMINDQIPVLSTDGISTVYLYYDPNGYMDSPEYRQIVSENQTPISPLSDIYEVYTNIIKNAKYYDDSAHQELEVVVSVTPFNGASPDFSYEVMSNGYASLRGSVHFDYTYEGTVPGKEVIPSYDSYIQVELSVVNPSDLTASLSDVDRVYASRTVFSAEDLGGDYEILYSIDEGKTWTDEIPQFTVAGTYKVYSIYKGDFSDYDVENVTIIAIQNITITD